MARRRDQPAETTPQARLSSATKSARDVMRKDAGLNGDLDRIPQLAWLLFLKAFDAREEQRLVTDRHYRPAIEAPFRWRDWAADPEGRTGPELLDFVNGELLPYLRELSSGTGALDARDTIAAVFKETYCRMLSGYLLRDVVDQVEKVNFTSSDDVHTMAHLYESMLREVRDAAGDSGEFYTPRPAIRFVVQQVAPKLGETILDPACGTGGFLVEALVELESSVENVEQLRTLHGSLRGIEKKPLPYLLGMMNLLLHGVEQPALVRDNALAYPVTQVRRADRVDIVLTNPPFGGEEERSIQDNFPDATRTAETALLFLQLIVRRLNDGGRCGMVVPNGLLFGDGVAARIKKQLLTECDVHTIVRLPPGVFAPYTDIPSNLLFFEKTGRTREVWFYEIDPPEGKKKYAKTRPMRFEEFAECQAWWGGPEHDRRVETEHAWRVPIAAIEGGGWNLDQKNPNRRDDLSQLTPVEVLSELIEESATTTRLLENARAQVVTSGSIAVETLREFVLVDVLTQLRDEVAVEATGEYPNVGVLSFGRGLFEKPAIDGSRTSARSLFRIREQQFIYSKLFALEGAYAVVDDAFDGYFVSSEFPVFDVDSEIVDPLFLAFYFAAPAVWQTVASSSQGLGLRRQRVNPDRLLQHRIRVPPLSSQHRLAQILLEVRESQRQHVLTGVQLEAGRRAILDRLLT